MSIVDMKLKQYGFRWELSPYTIVDEQSGSVAAIGPSFNLSDNSLQTLRVAFQRKNASLFK